MFAMIEPSQTAERMTARKEIRMRPSDEQRIKTAAASVGLNEADFIRQAALAQVAELERQSKLALLPQDAYEAFRHAVTVPGNNIPGLSAAATRAAGLLKDA